MLRLGLLKSVSKMTKILVVMTVSGTIFNLGAMTSQKCKNDAQVQGVNSIGPNDLKLEPAASIREQGLSSLQENGLRRAGSRAGAETGDRTGVRSGARTGARTGAQTGTKASRSGTYKSRRNPPFIYQRRLDSNVEGATGRLHVESGRRNDLSSRGGGDVDKDRQWERHQENRVAQVQNMHQNNHNDINATWVKEMISTMPNTKHEAPWGRHSSGCANRTFLGTDFHSTASVIITFHENEKVSRILHTVHSILQRTPSELLHEIILIDDHSQKEDLKEILEIYVKSVFGPKVSLRSNWLKKGLIGARLAGTRLAKGDVIVSMDSHMEVQEHWLEPLLWEIKVNRKTLAASYLDWVEYDSRAGNWIYRHGANTWKTYFDWTFTFGFQDIPRRVKNSRNPAEPVPSPVTVGTVFAINKQFFREIGEFDEQMVGWGGENLDLPLRVWMFGGRVVNVPCSHVAHSEEVGQRNYRLGWDKDILRNYRRVADVWLGPYRQHVYRFKPGMQETDPGDLSSRLSLRRNSVHDFTWFLDNVFPELGVPGRNVFAWGTLKNVGANFCLYCTPPNPPVIMDCIESKPEKSEFSWSTGGELRFPLHAFSAVTGYSETALKTDEWVSYYNTSLLSKWIHWKRGPLMDWTSRRCLATIKGTFALRLVTCNFTSPHQQWVFSTYTPEYDRLTGPSSRHGPSTPGVGAFLHTLRDVRSMLERGLWDKLRSLTFQPTHT